jgi:hypothetical protein
MARGSSFNSTLAILALIVLIALAVYYVMEEEDNDIEIDLGSRAVPVEIVGVTFDA